MLYCLNPNCFHPENPKNYHICQGCGEQLANSSQSYLFHDHYLIVQRLEINKLGSTYLTYDTNIDILQRPRILQQFRVLKEHINLEEIKENFDQQARKLEQLNHFQIPKIYDHFTQEQGFYLVQEYLEGETLLTEIKAGKIFNEENIMSLLRDMLLVLQYLHKNKVLHRNICPENLLRPGSKIALSSSNLTIDTSENDILDTVPLLPDPFLDTAETSNHFPTITVESVPILPVTALTPTEVNVNFEHSSTENTSSIPPTFLDETETPNNSQPYQENNNNNNNLFTPKHPLEKDSLSFFIDLAFKKQYAPEDVLWTATFSVKLVSILFRSSLKSVPLVFWQVILLSEFFKAYQEAYSQELLSLERGKKILLINGGTAKILATLYPHKSESDFYSPFYASPEQMQGECSPATDIYSLGVTCIRLLTGCLPQIDTQGNPFDPLYNSAIGRWVWREELEGQDKYIEFQLKCALERMLSSFPEHRYQSATEILTFLFPTDPAYFKRREDLTDLKRRRLLKFMGWGTVGVMTTSIVGSWIFKRGKPWEKYLRPFNFEEIKVNSEGQIVKRQPQRSQFVTVEIDKKTTIDFVPIPGGKFAIGSPLDERGRQVDESPQKMITVSSFFMSKYPVTQAQWVAVMGFNPSFFLGDNLPVDKVSWNDCIEFCNRLSEIVGRECRLPTEAEWEYACRAGSATPFYFGETLTSALANYKGDVTYQSEPKGKFRQRTTGVGSFPPNGFGLYDLHGNVWEWCLDTKHDNYEKIPTNGKKWVTGDKNSRILRGGAWLNDTIFCRSANRNSDTPNSRLYSYGCRVVAEVRYRIRPIA
jgi:formylglycine-generating enzyme required for sulfatase activity/tRNA A-37 threonylcarbamoyl transferase component Bud32